MASSLCWRGGYRCAECIAGAFLEVERACPYRREALFSDRNCTLELAEIRIFGTGGIFREFFFWPSAMLHEGNILKQVMASGLVFQAIGFGCLFFLLFQEWRSQKRGTLT
ncbi:unnamed protein product [Miscanthus lutarioriparius]|uniref:Uncharacterized protein n=1 Tax=Miscanthus lutarioriparius TaxID=422564 RepID=A0A811N7X0_9POAL|nr:unnamed protein product [Miscanthus lutarioriparius]CAD6217803.1 unnamed protein product [Miscanthus lutarioriparius]